MKAVIQRVSQASVNVNDQTVGQIDQGLLVLLGAGKDDGPQDIEQLVDKLAHLRIFNDDDGKMNLSIQDVGGSFLVVSQFTIMGSCAKGRRPSFNDAAPPDQAEALYNIFVARLKETGIPVETGQFRAMMDVSLVNDGPVTFIIDTRQ